MFGNCTSLSWEPQNPSAVAIIIGVPTGPFLLRTSHATIRLLALLWHSTSASACPTTSLTIAFSTSCCEKVCREAFGVEDVDCRV